MPVLVLLILLDIAVLALIMYVVKVEKPAEHTATHPFVIEAREAEEKARLEAAKTAEKIEEKAAETTEEKAKES
jgi:hypothetical protein